MPAKRASKGITMAGGPPDSPPRLPEDAEEPEPEGAAIGASAAGADATVPPATPAPDGTAAILAQIAESNKQMQIAIMTLAQAQQGLTKLIVDQLQAAQAAPPEKEAELERKGRGSMIGEIIAALKDNKGDSGGALVDAIKQLAGLRTAFEEFGAPERARMLDGVRFVTDVLKAGNQAGIPTEHVLSGLDRTMDRNTGGSSGQQPAAAA